MNTLTIPLLKDLNNKVLEHAQIEDQTLTLTMDTVVKDSEYWLNVSREDTTPAITPEESRKIIQDMIDS
jgi:hypothetical protein